MTDAAKAELYKWHVSSATHSPFIRNRRAFFLQESEKRVAAIEAEAEAIKREADAYVAKRLKVRRMFSFWKS